MNDFKLLIDTNVVIGFEDFQPVQQSLAELVRLSNEHAVGLFVDHANYEDVARDDNAARRLVTQSKLAKFPKLRDRFRTTRDWRLVLAAREAKTITPMSAFWRLLTRRLSIFWSRRITACTGELTRPG
jgi:hypothetical protein